MTPYDALLRFFVNNPHPIGLPQLAEAVLAVIEHAGFVVVQKEMTDAE